MIGFDESLFVAKQTSIVATRAQIEEVAAAQIARGIENIYILGAGGTYANALPYQSFAAQRSRFPVRVEIGTELMRVGAADFGPKTLAVVASVSGTTEDILDSMAWARAQGATILAFSGIKDSPIVRKADLSVITEPKAWPFDLQFLFLIGSILRDRGDFPEYDQFVAELDAFPAALVDVAQTFDPIAAAFADRHAETDYYFLSGAGNAWGLTYLYSMCVLEEMQWLRTTRVHGSEFFHGSLELLEPDTAVLLLQGEDLARPIMDRVIEFVPRVTNDVTIVDAASFALPGISPQFRGLLSPIVLDTATDRISHHLARVRNHSLDLRRYYRVMDY